METRFALALWPLCSLPVRMCQDRHPRVVRKSSDRPSAASTLYVGPVENNGRLLPALDPSHPAGAGRRGARATRRASPGLCISSAFGWSYIRNRSFLGDISEDLPFFWSTAVAYAFIALVNTLAGESSLPSFSSLVPLTLFNLTLPNLCRPWTVRVLSVGCK